MRHHALAAFICVALCACNQAPPEQAASTAPPQPPVKAPAAAPAATPAPAADIPEGECGDQAKLAPDQRIANTARWTTASEQNSFGFDVFRSDSERGEFAKLNKDPILGAGTSDETHKYEYRDDSIDPCREYWYYVEGIDTNGARAKFTPTFRAPPKRRAPGSAATAPAVTPPQPAQG